MASTQRFLSVIIFAINAYTASCTYGGPPDFVIPIPEVTVTIGGSVSSIPVQHEELIIPIVFDPVPSTLPPQLNFLPDFSPGYQSYVPQTPQVIILDDGNKNDMSWIYLLLLMGNFNNGGNGNNNCGGGRYYGNGYSPRSAY